jgi:ankyrin repeat protein
MRLSGDIITVVYRKDYAVLMKLLAERGSVNCCDRDGRTPLMHAVLAEDAEPRMVEFLIEKGADVNLQDRPYSYTALHCAAQDQKPEIVKLLLERGADVDRVDKFGNTLFGGQS